MGFKSLLIHHEGEYYDTVNKNPHRHIFIEDPSLRILMSREVISRIPRRCTSQCGPYPGPGTAAPGAEGNEEEIEGTNVDIVPCQPIDYEN